MNGNLTLAQNHIDEHEQLISTRTFNLLMKHYSKKKSLTKVKRIFDQMGPKRVNVISYTIVINALSKVGGEQAALQAESLMNQMNPVQPNIYTYNAILNAWCKSNSRMASTKCKQVFEEMRKNNIPPDIISYTAYICASTKDDPHKALKIMNETGLKFDMIAYFTLINSFSKVDDVQACMILIQRMVYCDGINPDRKIIELLKTTIRKSKSLSELAKRERLLEFRSILQ